MPKAFLLIILLLTFLGCQNKKHSDKNLIQFLPEETPIVFISDDFNELKKTLKEIDLITLLPHYEKFDGLDSLQYNLKNFSYSGKCVLGFSRSDTGIDFSLIVAADSTIIRTDSILYLKSESLFSKKNRIEKTSMNNFEVYSGRFQDKIYYSNRQKLIEDFIVSKSHTQSGTNLNKIRSGSNSILIKRNASQTNFPFGILTNDSLKRTVVADRMILDFKTTDGTLFLNGVAETLDKNNNKSLLKKLETTVPQETTFASYVPNDIQYAYGLTFDDVDIFTKNLAEENALDSLLGTTELKNLIELTYIRDGSNEAIYAHALDGPSTLENISEKSILESYKEIDLFKIEDSNNYLAAFRHLFNLTAITHFIKIDDAFIFSDNVSILKNCINAYVNENTLSQSNTFIGIMDNLSDESSIFLYYSAEGFHKILDASYKSTKNIKVENSKSYAVQYIIDNGFAHVNAVLGKSGNKKNSVKIVEQLQFSSDDELLSQAQFIENHINKAMDIAVQDINNNLILFDNKGNRLFKKQLDGTIIGEINTLESFNNGRKQLVFATSKSVYVVARNGKDVGNFPRRFKDEITQPLSLFDYDNNKKYRILITQGDDLYMMDKNGNKVNGFKYLKGSGDIKTQPQHFRFGRKDYLVFAEGDKLRVLSRTGKDRIIVSKAFNFSDNNIYPYQDKFTFSDINGTLVQVNQQGKVTSTPSFNNANHNFSSTSKTLASLTDNVLMIRSKKIELDYGNYTSPKIFYLQDKIYVALTDLQTNKIFLFDSQGKLISGFPVFGNSTIDLANIDKDNNLELLVKNGTKGLLVYQLK